MKKKIYDEATLEVIMFSGPGEKNDIITTSGDWYDPTQTEDSNIDPDGWT